MPQWTSGREGCGELKLTYQTGPIAFAQIWFDSRLKKVRRDNTGEGRVWQGQRHAHMCTRMQMFNQHACTEMHLDIQAFHTNMLISKNLKTCTNATLALAPSFCLYISALSWTEEAKVRLAQQWHFHLYSSLAFLLCPISAILLWIADMWLICTCSCSWHWLDYTGCLYSQQHNLK